MCQCHPLRAGGLWCEAVFPPYTDPDAQEICVCGDYRSQHHLGTGPCIHSLITEGDGHFGSGVCFSFRI